MSATDDTAARRAAKDKPASERGGDKRGGTGAGKHPSGDLSRALKTAYDDALREEIPKDFLDLLGKLR